MDFLLSLPRRVGSWLSGDGVFFLMGVAVLVAAVWLCGCLMRAKTRRELVTYVWVPEEGYYEDLESIRHRMLGVMGSLRRWSTGWLTGSVDGVRFVQRPDAEGRLLTLVTFPRYAVGAVTAAVGAMEGVSLRFVSEVLLPTDPLDAPNGYEDVAAAVAARGEFSPEFFAGPEERSAAAAAVAPLPWLVRVRRLPGRVVAGVVRGGGALRGSSVRRLGGARASLRLFVRNPHVLVAAVERAWERRVEAAREARSVPRLFERRMSLTVRGPVAAMLETKGTLDPNLLGSVAEVFAGLRLERGHDAIVSLSCAPVGVFGKRAYIRDLGKALDKSFREAAGGKPFWDATGASLGSSMSAGLGSALGGGLLGGGGSSRGVRSSGGLFAGVSRGGRSASGRGGGRGGASLAGVSPSESVALGVERAVVKEKDAPGLALMRARVQIKVRTSSRKSARGVVKDLRNVLRPMDGRAWFGPAGVRIGRRFDMELGFLGADSFLFRGFFDRTLRRFLMPTSARVVSSSELAPLLGPASVHSHSDNIRTEGHVSLPPRNLVRYDRKRSDQVPFGIVTTGDGESFCGAIPLDDLLMQFISGGTGNGKTETQLTYTLAVALNMPEASCVWIDPEDRVFGQLAPVLAGSGRVVKHVQLNRGRQYSWNPLDMSRRHPTDTDDVGDGLISCIKAALKWTDASNRALTMLTMVCRSLLMLNVKLCREGRPDLQATLFTIPHLIDDEAFRRSLYPFLPADHVQYWEERFPNLEKSASTVVTNLMDRLRGDHSALGAFLGRPVSTLSFSESLANGELLFISLPTDSDKTELIATLLLHELVREVRKRDKSAAPAHVFLDEVQMYDRVGGLVGRAYATFRKRNVKVTSMTQSPESIGEDTRKVIFSNMTHMMAGPSDGRNAKILAEALAADSPEALRDLERFWWLCRFVLDGKRFGPCRVRGVTPDQVFGDLARPDLVDGLIERMDGLTYDVDQGGEQVLSGGSRLARHEIAGFDSLQAALVVYLSTAPALAGPVVVSPGVPFSRFGTAGGA